MRFSNSQPRMTAHHLAGFGTQPAATPNCANLTLRVLSLDGGINAVVSADRNARHKRRDSPDIGKRIRRDGATRADAIRGRAQGLMDFGFGSSGGSTTSVTPTAAGSHNQAEKMF